MKLTKLSLQIGLVVGVLSIIYTAYDFFPKILPKSELEVEIQSCEVLAPHYFSKGIPLINAQVKQQETITRLHKYLKDSISTIEFLGVQMFNPEDSTFKFIKEIFIDSVTEKLAQFPHHQIQILITNKTRKELTNLSIDMFCDACDGWVYINDSLKSFTKGIIPLGNIGPKKSLVPKIFMPSNATYTSDDRLSFFNSSASGSMLTYSNGSLDIPRVVVMNVNSDWESLLLNFMENKTFKFIFYSVFLLGIYYLFFKIIPQTEKLIKNITNKFKKKPKINPVDEQQE